MKSKASDPVLDTFPDLSQEFKHIEAGRRIEVIWSPGQLEVWTKFCLNGRPCMILFLGKCGSTQGMKVNVSD